MDLYGTRLLVLPPKLQLQKHTTILLARFRILKPPHTHSGTRTPMFYQLFKSNFKW